MKPRRYIFQHETSFLGKLERMFYSFWELTFFRFLVAGGLNTLLGYALTLLLRITLFTTEAKFDLWGIAEIDYASTLMFVILFPVSYTIQARWTFRTTWTFKRMLVYPFSSLPNYGLQQMFVFLFETVLKVPFVFSYALAAIFPIPIMFFVIRFFVVKRASPSAHQK